MDKHISAEQRESFCTLISELKEGESLAELKRLHEEGYAASELLDCCMEGVRRVGERFEQGNYYISALIMAGEIMRQCSEFLRMLLPAYYSQDVIGHVLLGTIEGDIHDLGKNILKDLLECNGFRVTDLGVDVPMQHFVENAVALEVDIVAISCLLTTTVSALETTVSSLKSEHGMKKCSVIIGGAAVDQMVNNVVQADAWFNDAMKGVIFCRQAVGVER